MKKLTRYIYLVLLLLLCFNLSLIIKAEEEKPIKLNYSDASYILSNDLESTPLTVEATITLASNEERIGGAILSNFVKSKKGYMTFEVNDKGNPSVTKTDINGIKVDVLFDVVIEKGKSVHLAFVIDGNNYICYINGELKSQVEKVNERYEDYIPANKFAVGGDRQKENTKFFNGDIDDLAIYSDVRTAQEIASDYNAKITSNADENTNVTKSFDQENLMVGIDLSNITNTDIIEDVSINDNDLKKLYFEDKNAKDPAPEDYDYSFAVIGDTQTINRWRPKHMKTIYDYIVNNIEAKKIKHVAGLGDITDQSWDREYEAAIEQFKRLDEKGVSYSLIRGNHDSPETYEKYLGVNSTYCNYSLQYKDYFGNSTTTAHEFSAGNLDYLLITLDFGPTDAELEWASKVVEAHPYHNVIISTHGYMGTDGFLIRESSTNSNIQHGGYNEGTHIWDKLVSQHENIVLVLCGHEPTTDVKILRTKGVHGNVVTQMLIDTQYADRDDMPDIFDKPAEKGKDGYGVVSMLYFSNGGKTVDFRYYATIKGYHYNTMNQFRMNINVIKRKVDTISDEISNLPDRNSITLANQEEVFKLNELYLSLTDEEKATIDNTKLVAALEQVNLYI